MGPDSGFAWPTSMTGASERTGVSGAHALSPKLSPTQRAMMGESRKRERCILATVPAPGRGVNATAPAASNSLQGLANSRLRHYNLVEMIDLQGQALMLFDGDCGICSKLAGWAAAQDAKRSGGPRFRVEPYFEFSESDLAPHGLTWEECTHSVQLIELDGRVHSGAFAVNRFLWTRPWFKPLIALVYIAFPLLLLEMAGYYIVARNRHRISAALGMNECKIRITDDGTVAPASDH